jgi:hypothetical protein
MKAAHLPLNILRPASRRKKLPRLSLPPSVLTVLIISPPLTSSISPSSHTAIAPIPSHLPSSNSIALGCAASSYEVYTKIFSLDKQYAEV